MAKEAAEAAHQWWKDDTPIHELITRISALAHAEPSTRHKEVTMFDVMQELYASEIHGSVSWFYDAGFVVMLTGGSEGGEVRWRGEADTKDAALTLLAEAAVREYPSSQFAQRWMAHAEPVKESVDRCPYCANPGCVCDHKWGDSCRCAAETAHAEPTGTGEV
jgi:hypothetical protein